METLGIRISLSTKAVKTHTGWRCLHMAEGGYPHSVGDPAVRPAVNAPPVDFTQALQLLSFNLNKHNPNFDGKNWRAVYWTDRAFTNEQGFDKPGDPRADYINRLDLTRPLPKLMKAIICGGYLVKGERVGNQLIVTPGIGAIDANKPIPSVEYVLENNLYFTACTANSRGAYNFPQGEGLPVYIPYVLKEPTPYPIEWFEWWDSPEKPDPLRFYRV